MTSGSAEYDESRIRDTLDEFSMSQRGIFAAACAEWLFPSYEEFVGATGLGSVATLRGSVDMAWALAKGDVVAPSQVEQQRLAAESLVPDDDAEDWSTLSPVAQNAAAAAAYAIRVWLHGETQEAVWAARQLYEAADYAVQLEAASHRYAEVGDLDVPTIGAVDGIWRALEYAGRSVPDEAQRGATEGGRRLREVFAAHGG